MRRFTPWSLLSFLGCSMMALVACKNDSYLAVPPPPPDVSFNEEFDTTLAAYNRGWRYINVSDPKGVGFWEQGGFNDPSITGFPGPIPFPPFSSKGSYAGFIGTDYTSTSAGDGTISNWVVSPVTLMKNGDKIVFYTRTVLLDLGNGDSTDFANRMQVRISIGDGLNVGAGKDPGGFTSAILDINPFYAEYHTDPALFDPTAYPSTWTRFEATVGGLNGIVQGRFAFRYYVEDGGSAGRGTGIGLDKVSFISSK